MSLHAVILFLHIASAMGIFAALGIEALALRQLRASGAAERRAALGGFELGRRVGGPSTGLVFLTGIYLAAVLGRSAGAWVAVALLTLIVVAVIGGTTTGRRIGRLRSAGEANIGERDPLLAASFRVRTALLLGILYLMVMKPGIGAALGAVAVAAVVGAIAGAAAYRRRAPASGMGARETAS